MSMRIAKDKIPVLNYIIEKLNNIRNLKLLKKLIYSYILVIAIPTIALTVTTLRKFEENLRKDTVTENKYQLEAEEADIIRNFQALERMAQMVITNEKFMEYVKVPSEPSLEALVEFNQEQYQDIFKMQYSNPAIKDINFFSNNKNIIEIWPLVFEDNRVKNKGWYKNTIEAKGKAILDINRNSSDIYDKYAVTSLNYELVVAFCKAINDSNNNNIGVLRVNMPSTLFFSKMFNDNKEKDGQFYVIDKFNNIYTNESSKFIKENNLSSSLILNEFLKNKNSKEKNFYLNYDKKNMIVVYTKIEDLDIDILNVVSIDDMIQYNKQIRNFYILGSCILIIILSLIIYFITSIILKRLYIIIQSMKKLQQGDFSIELSLRSNDEIGELAHHFRKMLRKINELIQEAVDKRSATKEAELRALHNQIDSHFIYNTLENIKMMAEIDGQFMIADSINSLGAMMRYNMRWNSEFTTISEEITHIQNYIALMNVRFDNKISLDLQVENSFMEHEILKMSLQPLIENSVKHGLKNISSVKDFRICVNAFYQGEYLRVVVMDNGVGMTVEEVAKINKKISSKEKPSIEELAELKKRSSSGIGLRNVNERIKLFYGEDYGLEVFSEVNEYTKVIMTLPY